MRLIERCSCEPTSVEIAKGRPRVSARRPDTAPACARNLTAESNPALLAGSSAFEPAPRITTRAAQNDRGAQSLARGRKRERNQFACLRRSVLIILTFMETHVDRGLIVLSFIGAAPAGSGANVSGQLGASSHNRRFVTTLPPERGDGRLVLRRRRAASHPAAAPYTFDRTTRPTCKRSAPASRGARLGVARRIRPPLSRRRGRRSAESVLAEPAAAKDASAVLVTGTTQWAAPLAPLSRPTPPIVTHVKTGSSALPSVPRLSGPRAWAGSGAPRNVSSPLGDSAAAANDQTTPAAIRWRRCRFDFISTPRHPLRRGHASAAFEERLLPRLRRLPQVLPGLFPASGTHEYTRRCRPVPRGSSSPPRTRTDAFERWYSFVWGASHFRPRSNSERTGRCKPPAADAD
jgi:hypothetical protein